MQGLLLIFAFLVVLKPATSIDNDPDWWKKTIVYQIYPRSFQDSDGDGVGDIKGIISRLDHFVYMNIGGLWLSPCYKSPMADFGYDISDFLDIDPIFGTLRDFDELIKEAHKRGIRIIMDFIPNHTSDKHVWFQESRKGKDNLYSDFFIWDDGKVLPDGSRVPPNNWLSVFSGGTWTWDELRQQFYFHQFIPAQPDLNYRNPKVREEMKNVLRFWLDRGVDGFRIDAIATLFEVEDRTLDEPRSARRDLSSRDYFYLDHIYTLNQPEIHEVVREWRDVFDEHDRKTGKHTFAVLEIFDETYVESMKYYNSGADMPFNFNLIMVDKFCDGACIKKFVNDWLSLMPQGKWPNFVTSNHDRHRVTQRKGLRYADAMNVLLLTLPGTPTTYYGEEIAMNEIEFDYKDIQDPWGINVGPELYEVYGRDPCRLPMQWNDEPNAGFSSASHTWLPVHPDYKSRNVEAQKHQGPYSHLEIYRFAANLRRESALQTADIYILDTDPNLVSYIRYNPEDLHPVYLITLNAGNSSVTENHETNLNGISFKTGTVVLNTEYKNLLGHNISLKGITLKPGQALIIRLDNKSKSEL